MSVERETGVTRFTCDGARCRANYESDEDEFADAWREARAHGWVNAAPLMAGGDWQHFCPRCKLELGDD